MIVFETGSADWVDISRENGFCKNPREATEWDTEADARSFLANDSRYDWLLEKEMFEFQWTPEE